MLTRVVMLIKIVFLLITAQVVVSAGPDDHLLPELPKSFSTSIMWNIMVDEPADGEKPAVHGGFTYSVVETCDSEQERSVVEVLTELDVVDNNKTVHDLVSEKVIWNPLHIHGVNKFLSIYNFDSGHNAGLMCLADNIKDESYLKWLFGFDINCQDNCGFPSIANMLHWGDKNYTYSGNSIVNGIDCKKYVGKWDIEAWKTQLSVEYYWSDPATWSSSSGKGNSVPVSVVVKGDVTVDGKKLTLHMTVDYSDFLEISRGDSFYQPPSDLWCEGRTMDDTLPKLPNHFSFESEIVFVWPGEIGDIHVIAPRSEWYNLDMYVSRTDYKPPDFGHMSDPFAGKTRMVSEIQDFITGLSYTIDQTWGNCTVDYLIKDPSGDMIDEHGHVHMKNPLEMFFSEGFFAFNGQYQDRGIYLDSFIQSAPIVVANETTKDNVTTAVYLTGSMVEEGSLRFIPARIVRYIQSDYNNKYQRQGLNIFQFREQTPDFSYYDITSCFNDEPDQKMPFIVRMGWTMEMDIEGTEKLFDIEVRRTVMTWGRVTPIRVQNIQYEIDAPNKAYYLLFTILGYPAGYDVELNELPDAIRPIKEVQEKLEEAINKGFFKVKVEKNDGKGGTVVSQAEAGSLNSGTFKQGYSNGAMWALGIIMLLITVAGVGALLVFVLKW